jgi:hypothetical protein
MQKSQHDSRAAAVRREADRKGSVYEGGAMGDGLDLVLAKLDQDWHDGASSEHVALAADDRPLVGEAISRVGAEGEESESRGEDVDLDALARDVYPVLKRMLTIERERMGCA